MFNSVIPPNQVTYNTVEDQHIYQLNLGTPLPGSPSLYITRLIERLFAGATSPNFVANGLDITFNISSLNTNSLSFSVSPGLMMIDSSLVKVDSTDIITSDVPGAFPVASTSASHMIGIFANYSFSTTAAAVVTYSSYVMDFNKTLLAPTLFANTEQILLAVFDVTSNGTVWTSVVRQNARYIREIEPAVPVSDATLENSLTFLGRTYQVRGAANILASRLVFALITQAENVFILDSFLYKPFGTYLQWETAGIFSPG